MATHVADIVIDGSIESTLRQCATLGMCTNGDFTVSQAQTLANIAARAINVGIIAGQRPDLFPLYQSLVETVKKGYSMLGSTVMNGGSLQGIFDAGDAINWSSGFAAIG